MQQLWWWNTANTVERVGELLASSRVLAEPQPLELVVVLVYFLSDLDVTDK
jgi:hypothetical protein